MEDIFPLEAVARLATGVYPSSLQTRNFDFVSPHARYGTMLLDLNPQDPNECKIGI